MQNNKLVIIALSLSGVLLLALFFNFYLLDKITDNVIEKLKRDYVPGPYDPGFDPDKVNPNYFREQSN